MRGILGTELISVEHFRIEYTPLMSQRYPDDWDRRRKQVYKRDNYTCQNCGAKGGPRGDNELHAHHGVPLSKGGSNKLSNLTTYCKECHGAIHNDKYAPTADRNSNNNYESDNNGISIPIPNVGDNVKSNAMVFAIIMILLGYIGLFGRLAVGIASLFGSEGDILYTLVWIIIFFGPFFGVILRSLEKIDEDIPDK